VMPLARVSHLAPLMLTSHPGRGPCTHCRRPVMGARSKNWVQGLRRTNSKSHRRCSARTSPICIGGAGPKRTMPLVARYADYWHAQPEPMRERLGLLRS
jgi:hypothetical protein